MALRRHTKQARTSSSNHDLFDEQFLKQLEYLFIVSRKMFAGVTRSDRRNRRVGSGIEFADYRDYAPGDDFRYLDWNILGRMDRLLLRLFEQEEDLHIYLLLDTSASMAISQPAKLHYAMQIVAALAYVALANLDRVAVATLADALRASLAPARGRGRIFKILEFLRGVHATGGTHMTASVTSFVHQYARRGLAVLISDFYDFDGCQGAINVLRYNHFEPIVIQIYDQHDAHPPLTGDVRLVDCETNEVRPVTLTTRTLRAYANEHEAYCRTLEGFCLTKQVPYFRADTRVAFHELILRIFRHGGFLR